MRVNGIGISHKYIPQKQKNSNDLYSSTCGNLSHYFLNGFNTSLLLIGNPEVLLKVAVDGKGPLHFLTESLSSLASKQFKNLKQMSSQISMQSTLSHGSSLPHIKLKNDLEMGIYQLHNSNEAVGLDDAEVEVQDLVYRKISDLDAEPMLECDVLSGCTVKNISSFSIVANSSKEACRHLMVTLKKQLDSEMLNESLIVVEFKLTKILQMNAPPLLCWFRLLLLPATDNNKSYQILQSLIQKDSFKDNIFGCIPPLEHFLYDSVLQNSVTKVITFMDSLEMTDSTHQTLDLCSLLNTVSCSPVPCTPYLKNLLFKYVELIKKLKSDVRKKKEASDMTCDELKSRLFTLEHSYRALHQEKEDMAKQSVQLQTKYENMVNQFEKNDEIKSNQAAEKLKMTKELVELKLKGNIEQQNANNQLLEFKNKLKTEYSNASKYERDYTLEQKLHVDLKERYENLKQEKSEIQEELMNLKKEYIKEQEKTISDLLKSNEEYKKGRNDDDITKEKEFSSRLEKILTIVPAAKVTSAIKLDMGPVGYRSQLDKLEAIIKSLSKQCSDLKIEINETKKKLAEYVTSHEAIVEERTQYKQRLSTIEETLKKRSRDYEERLNTYISNIKEYVSNSSPHDEKDKFQNIINNLNEMSSEQERLNAVKLDALTKEAEQLRQENTELVLKCRKVLVVYRQSLELKNIAIDINDILPAKKDLDTFQLKKEVELQERLNITERELQKLQTKVNVFESERSNNLDLSDAVELQNRNQRKIEQENVELHERLAAGDKDYQLYRMMKEDELTSLNQEIFHLRQMLESQDFNNGLGGGRQAYPLPDPRLFPSNNNALPPLHGKDYWRQKR